MSRPEIVLAGLNAILQNLANLEQGFFEATGSRPAHGFGIDDSHEVTLRKESYTRSGPYTNISYTITFTKDKQDNVHGLNFYVRNPSTDDPSINMEAVASAIQYFLTTGPAITMRDEDATKFRVHDAA
ncbi:hypothetical protein GY45DRAFT_1324169 [Cubamyces sp. BRFM 1775]|nr:hypothetical protein GY45DRAFT_1324169 [Cubamyces sp. BRFM 1775]